MGNSVNFINASSGAVSYEWQEDGVTFSTAVDVSRTFDTVGTYTVSLIADSSICSDSSGVLVTVNPTYSILESKSVCSGDSVMLGGGDQTTAGTYYDSLVGVNNCDSVIITALVVDPLPVVDLGADTSICNACSLTLDAGAGFTNYAWSDGSNAQTLLVDSAGTYIVLVIDTNGCTNSDAIVVDIALTINQSRISNLQSLIIYPNPNSGLFTLEMDFDKNTSLTIDLYNFTGQLIYTEEIGNVSGKYSREINVSNYAKGIYYLQIVSDGGVMTKKVVYQ